MGSLLRGLAKQNAVVGDDANRIAVQACKTSDQRCAVEGLEFIEIRAVYQSRNDFTNIIGLARILGNYPLDLTVVVQWLLTGFQVQLQWFASIQSTDGLTYQLQRVRVIIGVVVGYA